MNSPSHEWTFADVVEHADRLDGITIDDFDDMEVAQGFVCAICGRPPAKAERTGHLHVDHDHETGIVRGLLCYTCNTGLGNFRDFAPFLRSAILYLESHRVTGLRADLVDEINRQLRLPRSMS